MSACPHTGNSDKCACRPDPCVACGRSHAAGVLDVETLCLPWTQVGVEVIDADADVVAVFVNQHDAYLAVQAVNGFYGEAGR